MAKTARKWRLQYAAIVGFFVQLSATALSDSAWREVTTYLASRNTEMIISAIAELSATSLIFVAIAWIRNLHVARRFKKENRP